MGLRLLLLDETLDGSVISDCRLRVEAAGHDLDTVAEALVKLINGRSLLIGAELADVLAVADGHLSKHQKSASTEDAPRYRQGRAVVIEGLGHGDGPTADAAIKQLHALHQSGFNRGTFVIALVGEQDEEAFSLQSFDEFITATCRAADERSVVITTSAEITQTAVVMIAFT